MNEFVKNLWEEIYKLLLIPLFEVGETTVTTSTIAQTILALILVICLARLLYFIFHKHLLIRLGIDRGNREAISTIIAYTFTILGFVIVLQLSGFDLGSLAVVAGGLGIGVGFGLQNIIENFISGLTLLLERNLKVGDFIEIDGTTGYLSKISLRSVIISTFDGNDIVLPNNYLTTNRIINWSLDSFKARVRIPVVVPYGTNPLVVTEVLLKSAYMEPTVCHNPIPEVLNKGFGDNPYGAIEFELRVWVDRIDNRIGTINSLNYLVEYNLRQHDIRIPFPQIWLRNLEILNSNLWEENQHIKEFYQQELMGRKEKPALVQDLLRQVPYFQNFTELELRQLIQSGRRRRLKTSEVLFREGEPGDAFYIILSGALEVIAEKINKVLVVLPAGKFVGEVALILGIPRTATVKAQEDSYVFALDRANFEILLKNNPTLANLIIQELAKHQEELSKRQQELRNMGLVDASEDDHNPVVWARKRLSRIFNLE
jgi:potassium-dependent mechanosensitive channel